MNFNEYITNDIEEKKVLLSVLPNNTPARRKKIKTTLEDFKSSYEETLKTISKFINYKYEKLYPEKKYIDIKETKNNILKLKRILKFGNNKTTYFEKMEFDIVLYNLMHYYDLSIIDINYWIDQFIKKFNLINIKLSEKDFSMNIYVFSYMKTFLENYKVNPKNEKSYEEIYWKCPKVIEYIIIVFRMLIINHASKFKNYCNKSYKVELNKLGFSNYDEVFKEIQKCSMNIDSSSNETEFDIIELCLNGKYDYQNLEFSEEKLYNDLKNFMISEIDINDQTRIDTFVQSVIGLKHDLKEYYNYLQLVSISTTIKKKYSSFILKNENKTNLEEGKEKLKEIFKLEKEIKKCKIKINSIDNIEKLPDKSKNLLFNQELLLDKLYKEYITYNNIYFDELLKTKLEISSSISDLYELIIFYPYFGRRLLKSTFDLEKETQIDEYIEKIEKLFFNPYRKIIDMIPIFVDKNITQLLMNGFRFKNINITQESLDENNMQLIFEKCDRVIRRIKAKEFELKSDEIKFLIDVKKLKDQMLLNDEK